MSNIDKRALRERYSPKPAPECHICGKEMTIQRMSASRITYGCTGATYDDKGCHYAEGRSIADDHYEQSRVTVVDVSDPDVLALLDELEHYKSREERVTKLVLDNSTSWDAQRRAGISDEQITLAMVEKLAVNKKRKWPEPKDGEPRLHIKEQPAPVVPDEMATSDDMNLYQKSFAQGWNACRAAMINGGKS
ncbi:dATP/dGTP pyrophosphohydrolase domain-containing protein [Salmonella enterica]|nr:DUF550 domain-containing protein [Salmonella enterica]EBU9284696.1 hypothetical protein [Salmonella enterica subsp. enterica serovar Virchow]EBY1465337.1 DUF550 domain-containing protein [Salmonella enterica subsp. enterica serovar Newington]ECE0371565.1 DUF550 domain-containing protein [Salmonella enterica subsp. enterica serovar Hvittingfoss]ECM5440776.1 DUF550 domain-containing protein [Salmonella enterica subsp. enterica serovar Schwarzengrund]EDT1780638.1 DUF550 domain-containing prote